MLIVYSYRDFTFPRLLLNSRPIISSIRIPALLPRLVVIEIAYVSISWNNYFYMAHSYPCLNKRFSTGMCS